MKTNLADEFRNIKKYHETNLIVIAAKVVLGSSVIRVFRKDTKEKLVKVLKQIEIDNLRKLNSQNEYDKWFKINLNRLANVIKKSNPKRIKKNIYPGYKWGHAAKILNLFVREIVENRRYFTDKEVLKLRFYLYVPIDSKIITAISKTHDKLNVTKIKEIKSEKEFDKIQNILKIAASEAKCPAIWFDDFWGITE